MGNIMSSKGSKYEPFLSSNVDEQLVRKLENTIDNLKLDMQALKEKNDRIDMRISRLETMVQNKYQELHNALYNTNERITIITKDMEALLNNDKLLLEKLIEKNIVSTIQETTQDSYKSI